MTTALLTVPEVADRLREPVPTVRKRCRNGEITASKIGKAWKVRESDLERFIDDRSNHKATDARRRRRA